MTLTDSTLEATLQSVVLHDVSELMPTHPKKRYKTRDAKKIDAVFVHHSGALGSSGVRGAQNSARYITTRKKKPFPGAPYHFWIPHAPLHDECGRLVVLRLQPDEVRCYHTGGKANTRGVGVALQGNTTSLPLTINQRACLAALLPWLAARFNLPMERKAKWLGWHSIATRFGAPKDKATCPGRHAERWLKDWVKS